jgi:hypothetical protein
MRGIFMSSVVLAAFVACANSSHAMVLVDASFDGETARSVVTDEAVDGFTANVVANTSLDVVDLGDGDSVVRFTDNFVGSSTPYASPYLRKSFNGVSTDGTGDNHVVGSFSLTRLSLTTGTEGSFRFLINKAGSLVANTSSTLVLLRVNGSQILYSDGSSLQTSLPTSTFQLAQDTEYTFTIDIDLSSDTQDTWSFAVADGTGVLYSSPTFSTAAPNLIPGELLFTGGLAGANASAEPFVQLDDISFSAVPEPTSMVLLGLAGLVMTVRRRGRSA